MLRTIEPAHDDGGRQIGGICSNQWSSDRESFASSLPLRKTIRCRSRSDRDSQFRQRSRIVLGRDWKLRQRRHLEPRSERRLFATAQVRSFA